MTNLILKSIKKWHGEYAFLSNNYPAILDYGGIKFPTLQHAFTASRSSDHEVRRTISLLRTKDLDDMYYDMPTRKGWSGKEVMMDLLKIKFGAIIPNNKANFTEYMIQFKKLAITGNASLIYGNTIHDNYWGKCDCSQPNSTCSKDAARNYLGMMMMDVRDKVQERIAVHNPTHTMRKVCNICGNKPTRTLLYSIEWWPRLLPICNDAECLASATDEACKSSNDKFVYSYDAENKTAILLPYKIDEPIKVPKASTSKTVGIENMSDEDLYEMYGYGGMGVSTGWSQVNRFPPPPTIERKYETLVLKGD